MTPIVYERPDELQNALEMLKNGTPLGGGTRLTAMRSSGGRFVDLQSLGLDSIKKTKAGIEIGAMVRIEDLLDPANQLSPALSRAARLEAGWNLRNQARIGGVLMVSDGRSPLLTALLAGGCEVVIEPGTKSITLEELLEQRQKLERVLLTMLRLPSAAAMAYEQVARSPADRPIVCAAACRHAGDPPSWTVSLGGFGEAPILTYRGSYDLDACAKKAAQAYKEAEDAWASSGYRSEVAAVLATRALGKVQ